MPQSDFWPFKDVQVHNEDKEGEAAILQKQLGDMEGEVSKIQMELAAIKKDRRDLIHLKQVTHVEEPSRTELALPDDRFNKFTEISKLREDLLRAKLAADQEKDQREKYESKLKDLELKLNNICSTGRVGDKDTRQADLEVTNWKSQVRDLKEEVEEMKLTMAEKNEELQDYRLKYLQAQQQVEELRRQLDVIEYDNKQVSDQIQIEIQKMKMQFQEKLQELAPLPDLLKGAQIQLQEAKQLQRLAEDSSQQLSNELLRVKEKLVSAVSALNQEKTDKSKVNDNNRQLRITLEEKDKEIAEIEKVVDEYKCKVLRLQEKLSQLDVRYNEKATECGQLLKDLDEMRVENSRSLNRNKERSDSTRRYLQTQISELERQLIQSRAQCRACQKERDEIRQRMQIQINNLQENFELVEIRLRALQSQVTSLKSSYSFILEEEEREFVTIASTT